MMAMIEYDKFRLSLKRLEDQNNNYRQKKPAVISDLDFEAFAESVVQRFEVCYDCLWKVLKRYLNCELGLSDLPNSPKPVLRLGNENNLFSSSIEQWLSYAETRVGTSHDYDGEKAQACLELVPDFTADAISLYQTTTGKTWD